MKQSYDKNRLNTAGYGSMKYFNKFAAAVTKAGISLLGSRILFVQGRKSGAWRSTPVNLLVIDGTRYLVAPRGHTQWVRNIRVHPDARLQLGRKVEQVRAVELTDDAKPEIIRIYLKKWAWEVGSFFGGDVTAKSPVEDLRTVAPGVPVFRLESA